MTNDNKKSRSNSRLPNITQNNVYGKNTITGVFGDKGEEFKERIINSIPRLLKKRGITAKVVETDEEDSYDIIISGIDNVEGGHEK